ncbi:GrpB family protein [Usitatibacter palustris]|uniref:GrpB family protein n=1 Tax=Usitatibacter palustris TaxID=2732487 RepID=A0A6M4H262_9PROT|nr:GrpB family protein [Usitatibacter palustris]QJR13566.1 hypothetical protein DSM104440_00350 [Usitatibacter palustris]
MEAPVHIDEYNPAWPALFEAERALIAKTIGPWLAGPIEHIGSTAVPGLAAKPVIDIMAPVVNLTDSQPTLERLRALSYCYFPYRSEVMHWFCKPSPELRTHHLHLVPFQSPLWFERIVFRDLLRNNPDIANEYAQLKRHLAELHRYDRELYTDSKAPFIARVMRDHGVRPAHEVK